MLCCTLTLLCAGGVSVVLPAEATSSGLEISVAEVAAKIEGDDAALVASVRSASLGYAPAPGFHRTLRADLVQASLRRSLPGVDVTVTGAPRCRVTPETVVVTGESIRAAASKAMRAALVGLDAEATAEGIVAPIQVPASDVPPRIEVPLDLRTVFPGVRSVPVEIWIGDKLYRSVHVTYRVAVWQRRAVLTRAVNVGEPLAPGMFEERRIPVADGAALRALGRTEIAGAVALRALPAGSTVLERDVHREVVVRRGDQVSVRVKKGPISVSDVGVAQADGRVGERVAVSLRSTGRELVAVVRGRRTLEVTIK
ncbi:MAG: flagellar basal body P-ring formation chaperone FlgA [Planctomycetota bacterium]